MSAEVVDSNPYSRLMALQRMGIVQNYERIREFSVAIVVCTNPFLQSLYYAHGYLFNYCLLCKTSSFFSLTPPPPPIFVTCIDIWLRMSAWDSCVQF